MIKTVQRGYVIIIIIIIRNYCRYIRMYVTTLLSESCNPATRVVAKRQSRNNPARMVLYDRHCRKVVQCITRENIFNNFNSSNFK